MGHTKNIAKNRAHYLTRAASVIVIILGLSITCPESNAQNINHWNLYNLILSTQKKQSGNKSKQPNGTKIAKKNIKQSDADSLAIVAADTTAERKDRIISLIPVGDVHILKIELRDYSSEINVVVYNLIGKKVLDVFKGVPKSSSSDFPYEIQSWRLPNGVYLCTLQGKDFRKTEKFVVAR